MALGVCGKRGCGGGIGTYPMSGSGSSYYKNNKNKCLWKFVPKGEGPACLNAHIKSLLQNRLQPACGALNAILPPITI